MTDPDVRTQHAPLGEATRLDRVALRVEGLTRNTGSTDAVHDVGFRVDRGELTAVMGAADGAAAGIMNVATGLQPAESGHAYIAGTDVCALSGVELARFRRANIGYLFRGIDLAGSRTVVGNIRLPFDLDERPISLQDARWLDRLVTSLGLASHLDCYPHELPPAQQQRVAIARALAPRPALVYGNEPGGDLDERDRRAITVLLRTMAMEYDLAVALVTADSGVGTAADRVVLVRDGTVAGTPRAMTAEELESELAVAA
ncbi:ATP-binding cassette domain-containing protein [Pseudoclavibacter chungangensis]|uniref:ATP-binding cassette domain-containing protein n=1 Tax=Pseudoclavibacter chungangensis TaxID=587635 RepID=A0A7J5BSH6_9MICO|nr:ATP-binding cassette domain-containing protein [Pseudoclavibacter chungangensis]KAB1657264.1 ATP-binding cassette domain-containing protein [Pseudoclavibacter chungangensis]NYJ66292.1 putative ABC transport system ATP-binding protein [Pseudoclavibacter chungangensis]